MFVKEWPLLPATISRPKESKTTHLAARGVSLVVVFHCEIPDGKMRWGSHSGVWRADLLVALLVMDLRIVGLSDLRAVNDLGTV
jgi:hypothetical protein